MNRISRVARDELAALQPTVIVGRALARLLPHYVGNRVRVAILRQTGWDIGRRCIIAGVPAFSGRGPIRDRLRIGDDTLINVGCFFELQDEIEVGERVSIGHEVMFLTSSHRIGPHDRRAGPSTTGRITVEAGVWIGSRSIILPGVTLGAGSVVASGSVVNKDVKPDTLVAGAPASVVVRRLPA